MKRLAALLGAWALQGARWQAAGQQPSKLKKEGAPSLLMHHCSSKLCKSVTTSVILDANWRHLQEVGGGQACFKANGNWNGDICPDVATCSTSCEVAAVTAAEYQDRYGIRSVSSGSGVQLRYASVTAKTQSYGSRVFVAKGEKYKIFHLKNREISITIDASQLPCGLRGAAYLVEMDEEGAKVGGNNAGAAYGTGYCDAQCPRDVKIIAGETNVLDWRNGVTQEGRFGSCCAEVDLWEGNSMSSAFAAHPCQLKSPGRCKGRACGPGRSPNLLPKKGKKPKKEVGPCDKAGCEFNTYRLGERKFYGPGDDFAVDTRKKITVVTQFLTSDGTDSGELTEIRRFYVHKDEVIDNVNTRVGDSITDRSCKKQKAGFREVNHFKEKGGLKRLGAAMDRGMVLVLSVGDDPKEKNMWLDSVYPKHAKTGGSHRGPCSGGDDSSPDTLRAQSADAAVAFSHIVYGEIGTTFKPGRKLGETLD